MKTSRLLEIIREEISAALNELTVVDKKTLPTEAPEIAKSENTDINTVKNAIAQAKKSGKPVNVAEAEDLNEIPDFGGRFDQQVAKKYGEDKTLEDATLDITNEILKDMGVTREDLKKDEDKAKEVLKAIRSKVVGKNQDPRVKKALEKQTEFDDSGNALQANQTNNAILKALGLKEPGQRGRKASEKPAEEKPAKAEKAPKAKAEPKKVEAEDDEDKEAAKAAGSDETAKELGSTPEEKKVKFNQFLASVKKNKEDKAKIDGILKLAKDKFKFPKTMMDDLKRAAGRDVEV
jgi:hypothetical protein